MCWVVSASFWFTGRWFLFLETVGSAQAWSDSTQSCLSLNGSRAVCLCTERAYIFWCELCAFFLVCVLKIVFCKHLNSVIPKGNLNWFNFYNAGVWTPVQTIRCGLALCVPSLKQSHLLSCHHIIRENGSCPPPFILFLGMFFTRKQCICLWISSRRKKKNLKENSLKTPSSYLYWKQSSDFKVRVIFVGKTATCRKFSNQEWGLVGWGGVGVH